MAKIFSIVYQPEDKKYEDKHDNDYIREPLSVATLIANHGLQGDAKAGRQPSRQLNILSKEWLESIKELGYRTNPGEFGEQIIVQGLDVDALQKGDRLQLGSLAVIEITMPRHGCMRLEAAQGRSNADYGGTVGQLARVVSGGLIQVGDPVVALPVREKTI